ncbi:HAMP domain-containing sensor histidine kinase [Bacillus massiliigorillae]|uniref:HAMP domain-containing sensor histidine kinase n=1 Tax=Bacillus massiliigorillae TaxID=1243664 RepID=UPI0003A89B58|nr:HAMP domain-containing sensor histidine kinase [Bacillus massiliigorillae]
MGLTRKTFLYSMIVSAIMVAFVIGYFAFMLPSLYVDHMKNSNYNTIVAIQKGYMKDRSYDKLTVKNPTSLVTIEIPHKGSEFYVTNKFFKATVNIEDKQLQSMIEKFRGYADDSDKLKEIDKDTFDFSLIKKKLFSEDVLKKDFPLKFKFDIKDAQNEFHEETTKLHRVSDALFVYEANSADETNQYTSYIAMGKSDKSMIITLLSVMTPQMAEIKPIIFGSLPMIVAVVFFIVLILSQVFAKKIINPIIRMAKYADSVKRAKNLEIEPLKITGNDEIGELGRTLNELYEQLRENYIQLEQKNISLAEENKRQEVFLRASSHQLKTPITAALLLIDSMVNEIGKYKNIKEYLPQVKGQLQSMRMIVENILYLNHCVDELQMESVSIEEVVQEQLYAYEIQMADKGLTVSQEGSMALVQTDREIMKKIIDNLLSNAVQYTPLGEKIEIIFADKQISIKNYGTFIEEELLPHIYEPFVSSNTKNKGHGLGLYVISYYAKLLGCEIKITNIDGGVQAKLLFS